MVTFATAKAMHGIEFESRNPADWAHGVTCAVFLIHGKSDKTIPYKHSEQIFERLDTFKELLGNNLIRIDVWSIKDGAKARMNSKSVHLSFRFQVSSFRFAGSQLET